MALERRFVGLLSALAAMSSNWDGQRNHQGVAGQNAQAAANARAAQRSGGVPPCERFSALDGAEAALSACNAEATFESPMDDLDVLLAPLPDGAVNSAILGVA